MYSLTQSAEHSVEVFNLCKKFGKFTAVDNISFAVKKGEIFGFLGPNGAGKSTTIRMLCGIIAPTSGYGTVGGLSITGDLRLIKQSIGYMSQKFSLYDDLSPFENLDFYSGVYPIDRKKRKDRVVQALTLASLEDRQDDLTGNLSGGQNSGWRWLVHCCMSPRFCFSMNRLRESIRFHAAIFGKLSTICRNRE